MPSYKLIYKPEPGEKKFLFVNVDMDSLSEPVSISREKCVQEEVVLGSRKKSEQVEYEDERYKKLLERESCPLVLEDVEGRMYAGKLQTLKTNGSCYFALINIGNALKVVPVGKWYRFHQRQQPDVIQGEEVADGEEYGVDVSEEEVEEREEIDFDEDFDDDDGEEANVSVAREKKLNNAGRKMRTIVENYEEKDESSEEKEEGQKVMAEDGEKERSTRSTLTKAKIAGLFKGKKVSLRELLRNVKIQYGLGDVEKEMVKEFIAESCAFETDGVDGEKYLVLKR